MPPMTHGRLEAQTAVEATQASSSQMSAEAWSSMQSAIARDPMAARNSVDGIKPVLLSDGTYFSLNEMEIYDSTKTSGGANSCTPETIETHTDVAGQPTVANQLTEYGEWLRKEAAKALNVELPGTAPELNPEQEQLLADAGPLAQSVAEKLKSLSQGNFDPTMRQDLRKLQELFNDRGVSGDEARQLFKNVCDAINMQLKASGNEWMRVAVSETTGEVYIGIKSQHDNQFKPTFELRSQTDCPEMPKK